MTDYRRVGGGFSTGAAEPPLIEALGEIHALLKEVAASSSPHRSAAVRYTVCRSVLLGSELRPLLPGFLVQCVSISRFHEFINLYHHRREARIEFVDAEMNPARARLTDKPVPNIFGEPEI